MSSTPTTSTSVDPLDFFNGLTEQRNKREGGGGPEKTYPGSRPPRNELIVDSTEEPWLANLPYKEFVVNGTPRRFYAIGALAQALGKSTVTIRSWEQKGWLPPATFRTPPPSSPQIPGKTVKGLRLYTKEQVIFLAEAYEKFVLNPRKPNWAGFRASIKSSYPRN